MADTAFTGTPDPLYNLILLTQQALEDCHRYHCFAADAREGDDHELADFFVELAQNDHEVAERAKGDARTPPPSRTVGQPVALEPAGKPERAMVTTQMQEGTPSEDEGKGARRRRPEIGAEFAYVVVHETGRGTVAWIRGDLGVSTAPALLRHVIDTLNLPLDTLVLDLADVGDIDHHGRAALQVAQKRATMRGVSLRFDGLDDEMRSRLERSS